MNAPPASQALRVRLFVALHLLAVGLIYLLAMLAGGGLGAAPWPPDLPAPVRPAAHASALAPALAPDTGIDLGSTRADAGPEGLSRRQVDLPARQIHELQTRLPPSPPVTR